MKTLFISMILSLIAAATIGAHAAQAQINPQPDSVPPAQGWVQLTSGTTAGFNFISLVGRDTVYVSGDRILRSTDAGATWKYLPQLPRSSGRLQFVDDTTGFLSGTPDSVFRTTDGGISWVAILGGSQPRTVFGSCKNGYVFGGEYTTDGGNSWHSSTGNSLVDVNCLIFADSVHAYAMGSSTYWNNGNMPLAPTSYRSIDGGASWLAVYPGPSQDAQGHPHSGIVNDIYGIAAATTDTLVAVGDRTIARSLDGGNTWDTIVNPLGFVAYNDAAFPNTHNGWTVTYEGNILHTTDIGVIWLLQSSGITSSLNAIRAVDTLTAYAVGDNGIILKTTNAGLSWVQLSPGLDSMQITEYPNPANSQMLISYTLPEAQHVTLTILDLTGNVVSQILDGVLQSGQQSVLVDLSRFPCGTYFAELCSEKYFSVVKFEKLCS